jgi:hypothetical protein
MYGLLLRKPDAQTPWQQTYAVLHQNMLYFYQKSKVQHVLGTFWCTRSGRVLVARMLPVAGA